MVDRKRKPFNKKSRVWKCYQAADDLFFIQLYSGGAALRECPEPLRPFSVHDGPVGQTEYAGSKQGHITTYLLRTTRSALDAAASAKYKSVEVRPIPSFEQPELLDHDFNISSRHLDLGALNERFLNTQRHDIVEFCHEKPGKECRLGLEHLVVETLGPLLAFHLKEPGKFDLVLDGKGTFHDLCPIDIGIDFSKGCVSTVAPDGTYDPTRRCSYCYAHQNAPCYLDTCYGFDEAGLLERIMRKSDERGLHGPLRLRFGQRTDANAPSPLHDVPGFPDSLTIALRAVGELAKERELTVAMPTKFPQYDPEVAKLLMAANVTVLVSIAYDLLEPGVVSYGFTVQKRLSEALKLAEAGVNTALYVATDITRSLEEVQDEAKRAREFFEQHRDVLQLQYLDMRITKRRDAPIIGGDTWERLKYNPQRALFEELEGRWQLTGQNYLAARETHPDFLDLIGNNRGDIRLCSTHVDDAQRCGNCFMEKGR